MGVRARTLRAYITGTLYFTGLVYPSPARVDSDRRQGSSVTQEAATVSPVLRHGAGVHLHDKDPRIPHLKLNAL